MNKVYSRGLSAHPWGAPVLMTWVEEVTLSALTLKVHNPVAQSVKFQLVKLGTESIWPDGVKSRTVVHKEESWTTPGVFGLQVLQ